MPSVVRARFGSCADTYQIMSQTDGVPDLIAKLSDAQRECLRLVNLHLTSKEIAIQLDVSRHTVDQRIDLACKKLGVSTRKEAARLLALYDPIIYETSDIANMTADASAFPDLTYRETSSDGLADYTLRDAAKPLATQGFAKVERLPLPFPRKRGDANALSTQQRLIWTTVIFGAGILISGALIAALETLGRVLG